MKKILFLFILINCISYSDTPFKHELRFGYDINGSTSVENETFTHKANFELVYEMYDEVYNNLDLGLGIILRRESSAREVNILGVNYEERKFANFTPLYITLKYRFPFEKFSAFTKLNIGYSFNHSSDFFHDNKYNTKDSLYYAVGTGLEFNNFIFDLSYQIINYKIEKSSNSIGLENSRITVSLGYQFE